MIKQLGQRFPTSEVMKICLISVSLSRLCANKALLQVVSKLRPSYITWWWCMALTLSDCNSSWLQSSDAYCKLRHNLPVSPLTASLTRARSEAQYPSELLMHEQKLWLASTHKPTPQPDQFSQSELLHKFPTISVSTLVWCGFFRDILESHKAPLMVNQMPPHL